MKANLQRSKYTLVAATGVLLGSFLPWASVLGFTKYGYEGDGAITAVLAVLGLLTLVVGWRSAKVQAPLAGLAALVPLFDMGSFAAAGVYVTFASAAAWLVLVMLPLLTASRRPANT